MKVVSAGWARARIYGEDSPFGQWIRENPYLQRVADVHLSVTDVDHLIERYITRVDRVGTRDIQAIRHIETKTRGKFPSDSQIEVLTYQHQLCETTGRYVMNQYGNLRWVRHYGVSILQLSAERPNDSDKIALFTWRRSPPGWIQTDLNENQLARFVAMEISVSSSGVVEVTDQLRRHHKSRIVTVDEKVPLGFITPRTMIRRS